MEVRMPEDANNRFGHSHRERPRLRRREFLTLVGYGAAAMNAGCGSKPTRDRPAGSPTQAATLAPRPSDLTFVSAKWMADAIRAKAVSSVEVVEACLRRIEDIDPKINAVVTLTADAA